MGLCKILFRSERGPYTRQCLRTTALCDMWFLHLTVSSIIDTGTNYLTGAGAWYLFNYVSCNSAVCGSNYVSSFWHSRLDLSGRTVTKIVTSTIKQAHTNNTNFSNKNPLIILFSLTLQKLC